MKNTVHSVPFFFLVFFCWQNTVAQSLSVGVVGGVNVSAQTYELADPNLAAIIGDLTDPKLGLSGGATFGLQLTRHLGLRTDVLFSRQGSKIRDVNFTDENGNPTSQGDVKLNFDYLQVPLLVELSGGQSLRWFVNAGPGFNFLLATNEKGGQFPPGASSQSEFTKNITETDYSLIGGLGLRIPLTEQLAFTVEGRANLGLRDVKEEESLEVKNRSYAMLAGMRYGF